LNVLVIATCGLVYELLAGTLASYVLGDSVTQFSLIIGIYLFAMGAGAWLSRFIEKGLARRFIEVEIAVALLGGLSAPLLFLSFARLSYFQTVLYSVVFLIGTFVGLEIPLLMRILKDNLDFKEIVSRVLAFDYIGALIASLLFPLFLVPRLGLVRTSLLFGMLNAAVGLWATWFMRPLITGGVSALRAKAAIVLTVLAIAIIKADALTSLAEDDLFTDPIVYSRTSHYQRIVVTRGRAGFQLFLNGHLQFSSMDEYRYHEALAHPAMLLAGTPRRVLVLGGGDGLAVREVLRYPSVEAVTLVDLDPEMTKLSAAFPPLAELNQGALSDPRVQVINQDAMIWLEEPSAPYDAAIIDFPDPNTFALGKLYTTRFYRLLQQRLTPQAAVSVQCTSPLFARASYWCIIRTMEAAGFSVRPYQTAVPSFGVWGFVLARLQPFELPANVPEGLRFLNDDSLAAMFTLPEDLGPVPVEINRLDNQALVRYYEAEWRRFE
ncbi:MAG TPA: polyamine aminopropyltransferase, partial [Blastocatellia bacterium]|nr:polyamine aminopropyltransferase [Blastocatellia bacterium]